MTDTQIAVTNPEAGNVSAASVQAQARTIGSKAGKVLNALLGDLVQKDEDVRRGPCVTLMGLIETYGLGTLADWPRPGTDDKEGDNNPEVRHIKVPKQEGGYRTQVVNFYSEFFAGTEKGQAWNWIKAQIELALDISGGGAAKVDAKFFADFPSAKNNPMELKAMQKLYGQRITKGRNYVRRAVSLYWALADLNEYAEKVTWSFDLVKPQPEGKEDDETFFTVDNLKNTPMPIKIAENVRNGKWVPLAASQVLQLNPEKAAAMEGGMTYDNLLATLGRGAKTNDGTTEIEADIKAPEQLLGVVNALATALNPTTDDGVSMRAAVKQMFGSKRNGAEYVYGIGALYTAVFPLFKEIEDEYNDMVREHNKREAAERKGKQAA